MGEKVRDEGVYLLENGIHILLFVGLAVDPQWIQDVFGVATAAQIDIDKTKLVERDNPLSRRVCDIYTEVTANKPRTMKLTIVRQRTNSRSSSSISCVRTDLLLVKVTFPM